MTEEILFYPIVFIGNHKKLLCIDVVIVDTPAVKMRILRVDNLKATRYRRSALAPESSLDESELLLFGIVYNFLNEDVGIGAIASNRYDQQCKRQ